MTIVSLLKNVIIVLMPRLNKLSIKQKKFVKRYVETGNATQAALEVYNTKNPKAGNKLANDNLSNPKVIEEIDKVLAKQGISLETTTSRLHDIANWTPDKVSSDTVLKANIELIKLLKGYPESKKVIDKRVMRVNLNSKDYKELIQDYKTKNQEIQEIIDSY